MPEWNQAAATQQAPLFRAEALRFRSEAVFGPALIAAPVSFALNAAAASLLAIAVLGILVFGRYTQRDTVSGYVAVSGGEVRVYPQSAGIVDGLLVSEGDHVIAGTPLLLLSTSRHTGMSTEANTEILAALAAERTALDEQYREQQQYFAKESERLRINSTNTDKLIGTLRKQQQLARNRHGIVQRDLERARSIRKNGFLSDKEFDMLVIAALDSELIIESNQVRIDELEAALDDIASRLEQLGHLRRTRISEIAAEASQIEQRFSAMRAAVGQKVIAPVDGQVGAMHVVAGQNVSPDTLALSLIPAGARFHAELFIPGRSIGQLHERARIELRFDAYPFEKFGVYGATIDQVARSLLLPGDARVPVALPEPVYRARALLDQQYVGVDGDPRPLTAGLTFRADILLSERSLIEWMLAPLIAAKKRL